MSNETRVAILPAEESRFIQLAKPFERFSKKAVSGSYPLFFASLMALVWANLSAASYHSVWHAELTFSLGHFQITKSLVHWVNEALMSLFFFTVGLEIKRELLVGELASPKRALLPIAAALGGMLFPAIIYMVFNFGTPTSKGWGVPMATDIAFSLAVLAIMGKKIPFGTRIFLSAFAIADDLGAVLVIALFYTQTLVWHYLLISILFLAALAVVNMLRISLVILPLFALTNAGLSLKGIDITNAIHHPVTPGIFLGLVLGKPTGIFLFTYLASRIFKAPLVSGVNWGHILRASMLGGIGFTMSLFISHLSFSSTQPLELSKLGIILGSVVSGIMGLIVLSQSSSVKSQTSNPG